MGKRNAIQDKIDRDKKVREKRVEYKSRQEKSLLNVIISSWTQTHLYIYIYICTHTDLGIRKR